LLRLRKQCPRLTRIITRHLAERVLHLIDLVEDLSLRTVEARLARLLFEESPSGKVHRQCWTTQAEIAVRLGTGPDVLHRALHNLAHAGLIEVKRYEIQILAPQNLQALSIPDQQLVAKSQGKHRFSIQSSVWRINRINPTKVEDNNVRPS